MIVVDASALLDSLAREDTRGERVSDRLRDDLDHCGPDVVKAETLSGLRRLAAVSEVADRRVISITHRIMRFRIETFPIDAFIPRVWALRHNLAVFDAWYVALAEALDVPLVTTDGRLARTPGIGCEVELIA